MYPGKTYRYTLKKGLTGHDVWALQINLNHLGARLTADGAFGPITELAAKNYQTKAKLVADGIAGPLTQRAMALELIAPASAAFKIPEGLVKGIVEGESGFFVGCVNWGVPPGVDCGWTQDRVEAPEFSDSRFHEAFDGRKQFAYVASMLRSKKNEYYKRTNNHKRAWELAVLYHNWPFAAEKLVRGGTLSKEPIDWVIAIGVAGIDSPAEWADFYISTKTHYVTEWTP